MASWIVNHICFSWFEREPQDDVNIQGLNTCEAVLVQYKVSKIKIRNKKTSEQYFPCHVLKVFMCTQSLLSGCQDVSISAPARLLTLLTSVPRVDILQRNSRLFRLVLLTFGHLPCTHYKKKE